MLPQSNRLNLKKDFKWVASGKKIETIYSTLFIKEGSNDFPKIGIALSGKKFKSAVDRNRAKRLISQAFSQLYHVLPNRLNIVALPKAGILEVKSAEVLSDLEKVFYNEKTIN